MHLIRWSCEGSSCCNYSTQNIRIRLRIKRVTDTERQREREIWEQKINGDRQMRGLGEKDRMYMYRERKRETDRPVSTQSTSRRRLTVQAFALVRLLHWQSFVHQCLYIMPACVCAFVRGVCYRCMYAFMYVSEREDTHNTSPLQTTAQWSTNYVPG